MSRNDTAKHPQSSRPLRATGPAGKETMGHQRTHSFSADRRGESSAGALSEKDKKRAVAASSDGSNKR